MCLIIQYAFEKAVEMLFLSQAAKRATMETEMMVMAARQIVYWRSVGDVKR
jgi:hypothetical protein